MLSGNSKNTTKTAEELHVHRNSVYYRINKCTELLPEIDFENGTMAFMVMLSLYIAQYDYYLEQIAEPSYKVFFRKRLLSTPHKCPF